jgi:Mrp family chromosome partitioning ATPase
MASDNLNRVFIKAYGKGKPARTDEKSNEQSNGESNAWIVRFDTATVPTSVVPQMHNERPPRHESAMVRPDQSPVPKPQQQKVSVSSATTDQQISQRPAPVSRPGPVSLGENFLPTQLELSGHGDLSHYFGGSTVIVPQATLGNFSAPTPKPTSQPVPQPSPQPDPQPNPGSAREPAVSVFEPLVPTHSNAAFQSDELHNSRSATKFDRPEETSYDRTSPQHSVNTRNSVNTHNSDDTHAWDLQQKIAAKNKSGEIFRLDRPSYAPQPKPSETLTDDLPSGPSADSSLTAVADLLELNSPAIHTNRGKQTAANHPSTNLRTDQPILDRSAIERTSPAAQSQQAIAKERDLRQARVRIFNPLWEVDHLEWPRVCVELLNTIDSKTTDVAKNLLSACQDGLQVLAVTSPQSGAGTSTVACCLAMIAGRHGLNIALVDGNMENPSLCYQTNLELEVDWHEALARKLPLEEIAVHSVDDQVTLVPLLARLSAPQLNEQNMAKMLSELSQSFDLVVVDLGHMASSRNLVTSLGDLGAINAVVAVVDRRNNSADAIESCLRQIRQTGIASIGLVENFAA